MLTTARKTALLERLARDGHLEVTPLAIEFDVSEDTLRRDLRDLAAAGKLVRVHGGAVPASPTHQPVSARITLHGDEKGRLARKAASLIGDDVIAIVDGGTTHLGLAAALPLDRRCTIVTHSPAIAASFEAHRDIDIILIGGRIFRHSMVAMGAATAQAFTRIRADICLLGVTGIHPHLGLTTGDAEEAQLKAVMAEAAGEIVVTATADKIGRASPWTILPLDGVATLISAGARPHWLPAGASHLAA